MLGCRRAPTKRKKPFGRTHALNAISPTSFAIPNVIREPAVKTAEKSRAAAKGHKQTATNKMASEASDADALSQRRPRTYS